MTTAPTEATAAVTWRLTNGHAEFLLARNDAHERPFADYWAFPHVTDAAGAAAVRSLCDRYLGANGTLPPSLALEAIGRLTLPAFAPAASATTFLLATAAIDGNLSGGRDAVRFWRADELLAAWHAGREAISPLDLLLLRAAAESGLDGIASEVSRQARGRAADALDSVHFAPGIEVAPLPTPTLAPATTTNCLVVGDEVFYVVDPATYEVSQQGRLIAALEARVAAGQQFGAVLLTHHHRDHWGAVNALCDHFDVPLRAHADTYDRIGAGFKPGPPLSHGDRLALGTAPDGAPGWALDVVHTPGHARDHLCYIENRYHGAIVGDMLSTVSTIVIDPPEGHMRTYLESLHALLDRPMGTLYPAHGPAYRNGHALIRYFLEHRHKREEQIAAALEEQPRSVGELLPEAYGDVSPAIYPVAARSLVAGLDKLVEDGRAVAVGDAWRRA